MRRLKIKSVEQGFIDARGFHPIRAGADYRRRKNSSVTKARLYIRRRDGTTQVREFADQAEAYAVWLALPRGVRAAFRGAGDSREVYAWDYVDRLRNPRTLRGKLKQLGRKMGLVKPLRNPIPVGRFCSAKIRRTRSGDVQILLPGRR
jgi:hypothetical protein